MGSGNNLAIVEYCNITREGLVQTTLYEKAATEFVQQGIDGPGVWNGLKGQVFLGTDAFAEAMQRRLEQTTHGTSKEIPRLQRRALAKSLHYYRDTFEDKRQGMAAAYATVSRAVNGK